MENHHLMNSKKLLLNSYFYKTNHNGWLTRAIRFFIRPNSHFTGRNDVKMIPIRQKPRSTGREAENILIFPPKKLNLHHKKKNTFIWQTLSYPICFPTKTHHKSPADPVFSNAVQANTVKEINFWG